MLRGSTPRNKSIAEEIDDLAEELSFRAIGLELLRTEQV